VTTFTIPGIPMAQPRQRHRVAFVGGKMIAKNYLPQDSPVNAFKAAAALEASKVFTAPLEGAICLTVLFILPRPKSKMWKSRPMPREWHTSKPDLDNLEKALKDALKGVAWRDDAQVTAVVKSKVVAAADEVPRTRVKIEVISQPMILWLDGDELSHVS